MPDVILPRAARRLCDLILLLSAAHMAVAQETTEANFAATPSSDYTLLESAPGEVCLVNQQFHLTYPAINSTPEHRLICVGIRQSGNDINLTHSFYTRNSSDSIDCVLTIDTGGKSMKAVSLAISLHPAESVVDYFSNNLSFILVFTTQSSQTGNSKSISSNVFTVDNNLPSRIHFSAGTTQIIVSQERFPGKTCAETSKVGHIVHYAPDLSPYSMEFSLRRQLLQTSASSGSGLSGGAIAGIVVGAICGVILLGVAVFFCVRYLRRRRKETAVYHPEKREQQSQSRSNPQMQLPIPPKERLI